MADSGAGDRPPGDDDSPLAELGIAGYEQARRIGEGGFSVVYKAWQPSFKRHVAIKVLSQVPDPDALDRFGRECAAIGALSGHPNIVTVHESGRLPSGQPFIVMEFLSGGSLAQRLAGGPLGWQEAADIAVKLAAALESAHRAGVLHRDVKPDNVMVSTYRDCKLGDFGIARVQGEGETRSGVITASLAHAAPEVIEGRRPTVLSDVYSLASTVFALLDGRAPFVDPADASVVGLLSRIVRNPVRPIGPDVPEAIEAIVRQGLEREPARRQPTAAEFGRQLQGFQSRRGVPVTALPLENDGPTIAGEGATQPTEVNLDVGHVLRDTVRAPLDEALPVAPPAPGRRRGRVLALVALVVAGILAALVALTTRDSPPSVAAGPSSTTAPTGGTTRPPVETTSSAPAGSAGPGSSGTTGAPATSPSTAAGEVRLGPGLPPDTTEPCRQPRIANGAAWTLGPARMGSRSFDLAYSCNLFSGASGSLDFVLGKSYRLLRVSVGFADASASTSHQARFEITGDDREYLVAPMTLKFGDVRDLEVNVSGVTRLRLKVVELSPVGGDEAPSTPVLAMPTLVHE